MNPQKLIRIVFTLLLFCSGDLLLARPPGISFAGGDGSSLEKAVIIKGATTEETGVRAEYEYLAQHYPGYKRGSQSLLNSKGRAFDAIEFTTADGRTKTIYFDITAFFGH
ncbi:MAG: hypothetical protein QOE70_5253 [Chthoniobacter sp.]|jgi:hypothetical protein|nr:hypothetical protein [Chthoniobacter sp.]